jgi:hypothetical protein
MVTKDLAVGQPEPLQQRGEERLHRKTIVLSRVFFFDMVASSFGVAAFPSRRETGFSSNALN